MTRFWDGRTDGQTDGQTDGRSDCTPRPAFAFGDAGKNLKERIVTVYFLFLIHISFTEYLRTGSFPPACLRPHKAKCKGISPSLSCILTSAPEHREDRIE